MVEIEKENQEGSIQKGGLMAIMPINEWIDSLVCRLTWFTTLNDWNHTKKKVKSAQWDDSCEDGKCLEGNVCDESEKYVLLDRQWSYDTVAVDIASRMADTITILLSRIYSAKCCVRDE